MALRVMQICVPQGANVTADELLEGRNVLGRWNDEHNGQTLLHLLVPAEETEPIMDQFEQHFAAVEGFHVVLFPVEAVLPRPKVDEKPDETTDDDGQDRPPNGLRVSREELYAEVTESVGVSRVFIGMTILSSVVAAVGLMRDDVAVIIGAMVIAPLLGPNVAMSLATTLGDTHLLRRAACTNLVVAGILLGDGQPTLACGALLLTGANVICINLAGIVTFLAQGVRPRTWWETERAKSGTFKATIVWTILLALLLLILWLNSAGLGL